MATTATTQGNAKRHQEHALMLEPPPINVGEIERWGSGLVGGTLALYGLSRGSLGGLALALAGGALVYRGATGHCPAYGALGYSTALARSPHSSIAADQGVRVEEKITILRPVSDVYEFWRNLENLPKIMNHIQSIKEVGPRRYRWVVQGPLGHRLEWDAVVHTERENELISWRSLSDSEVNTAGSVHFKPAPDGGTEVNVVLKYDPPAGKLGAAVSRLLGQDPKRQIHEDLGHFKRFMETIKA